MIEIKDFKKTIPSQDYSKIQEYIEQIRINLNILNYDLEMDKDDQEVMNDTIKYVDWIGNKLGCWEEVWF